MTNLNQKQARLGQAFYNAFASSTPLTETDWGGVINNNNTVHAV